MADAAAQAAAAAAAGEATPEERLRDAAEREGDPAAVQEIAQLLDAGADINAAGANGETALHAAACAGHVAAAALLLERGANVAAEMRQFQGWQPLHMAAANGHEAMVSLLLAHGADAGAWEHDHVTPMHYAAVFGRVEAVRALLDAGVPVNAPCSYCGATALHVAAANGCRDVATLLLERGANVLAVKNSHGQADHDQGDTPLHSLMAGNGDAPTLELLLAAGADASACNDYGETPLHKVAFEGQTPAHLVPRLLAAGARLDAEAGGFRQPLHYAAFTGNLRAVEALLQHGADVNVADDWNGESPLHLACREAGAVDRKLAAIKALLEAGADPKAANNDGRQPLHELALADDAWTAAAAAMVCDAVARLEAAGADLDAVDDDGNTPLMLALKKSDPDSPALRALVRHGARAGPPRCGACADLGEQRTALRSLAVGTAAEAARLRREREAWREERAALEVERKALEAARLAAMGRRRRAVSGLSGSMATAGDESTGPP